MHFPSVRVLSLFPHGLGLSTAAAQTSAVHEHQVYCPDINRVMAVLVLIIVGAFQHSGQLTAVYGACVGLAFLCDSCLRMGVAYFCQARSLARSRSHSR